MNISVSSRNALWAFMVCIFAWPSHPSGSTVVETYIQNDFPESATFFATIETSDPVARTGLFIRHDRSGKTDTFIADLEASATGLIAHVPLEDDYLLPFEVLTYWWQIDFQNGSSLQTEPNHWIFEDSRQDWQRLEDEFVTVSWVEGNRAFGQSFLDLAQDSIQQVQTALAISDSPPIWIYLYPSTSELRSVISSDGQHWVGGRALESGPVILIAAGADPQSLVELERTIPHEVTHLLLQHRMGSGYENLPAWLVEGLAGVMEGSPDADLQIVFESAARDGDLLPMESLCSTFPVQSKDAQLAYGQSESFVRYLADIYGSGSIVTLLDAYQEGASCAGAIQRVYQRPLSQLEVEWLRTLPGGYRSNTIWLLGGLLAIAFLGGIGIFWIISRQLSKNRENDV